MMNKIPEILIKSGSTLASNGSVLRCPRSGAGPHRPLHFCDLVSYTISQLCWDMSLPVGVSAVCWGAVQVLRWCRGSRGRDTEL